MTPRPIAPPTIRSRKIRGFLRALERYDALRRRYDEKLRTLEPLRIRRDRARNELKIRAAALNVGQRAAADQLWRARVALAGGGDPTTARFDVS